MKLVNYWNFLKGLVRSPNALARAPKDMKSINELKFWVSEKGRCDKIPSAHYEQFFTRQMGLSTADYSGKAVLDIGCGPAGSLEWASMARKRVGLDPLADSYLSLGADKHSMEYCSSPSESIPFPDGTFDIVSSFNSLDHVNDLDKTISEIIRVLAPGGAFLLIADIHEKPTICEPIVLKWDLPSKLLPLQVVEERHVEKKAAGVYQSVEANVSFDHADSTPRYGILVARLRKPA